MKVGDLVRLRTDGTMGIITEIRETVDADRQWHREYRAKWFYTLAPEFVGVRDAGNWYFRHHLENLTNP